VSTTTDNNVLFIISTNCSNDISSLNRALFLFALFLFRFLQLEINYYESDFSDIVLIIIAVLFSVLHYSHIIRMIIKILVLILCVNYP